MNTPPTPGRRGRLAGAALWLPGLAVAIGTAVATAHGLYQVAAAAGVPTVIAWLYPLITDGLAVVAYASTAKLAHRGRRYAWCVVILAAGLSGLAQASYLAAGHGPTADGAAGHVGQVAGQVAQVSGMLRFGVGAWPAIAAAIMAHLLFMLTAEPVPGRAEPHPAAPAAPAQPVTPMPSATSTPPATSNPPSVQPHPTVQLAPAVQRAVQPDPTAPVGQRPTSAPVEQPAARPALRGGDQRTVSDGEPSPRERARHAARRHHREHGTWPTVTELKELADVSRGTAGTALQELREQPAPVHVVHPSDQASADR